jgi:hypothetical protein
MQEPVHLGEVDPYSEEVPKDEEVRDMVQRTKDAQEVCHEDHNSLIFPTLGVDH